MRYTTVIDITENPTVYRNHNARLVYLHMVLKSGYHDNDRDLIQISIRRLAQDVGLTVSATRHALAQLERAHLVARQGPVWYVKKWLLEPTVSQRARSTRQQRQIEAQAQRRQEEEKRALERDIEATRRENLRAQGKTSFMLYYESLEAKAAAGDIEAARLVVRHRSTYESHQKSIDQDKTQTKT